MGCLTFRDSYQYNLDGSSREECTASKKLSEDAKKGSPHKRCSDVATV